ncbi:MAG: hypothetical protein ABIZ81_12340 [Opitutaceae bacterium]
MPLRSLMLLAALFAAFTPSLAETIINVPTAPDAEVSIRLAAPWTQTPRFGFAPVRVSIENRARTERAWRIRFEAGTRNLFPGIVTTDETISVPAGQTRDVWVFAPVAEPGMNLAPTGSARSGPTSVPPVVNITTTATGKKIIVTRALSGSSYVTETDIDATTGVRRITAIPPSGPPSTRIVNPPPLTPGSVITFTIDPISGGTNVSVRRTGSSAPAVVNIVTSGPPGGASRAGAAPFMAGSAFVSTTPMVLAADISGPGVTAGHQIFPGSTWPNGMRPFAVSAGLEALLRSKLSSLMGGAPNLSVVEVAQLPADWRVWSSFSGVVLSRDEYAALDAARRGALRAWVALGGQLYLSPVEQVVGVEKQSTDIQKLGAGAIVTFSAPLGTAGAEADLSSAAEVERAALWAAEVAARRARGGRGGGGGGGALSPVPTLVSGGAALVADLHLFAETPGLPDRSALVLENGSLFDAMGEQSLDNTWLAVFLVVFAVVVGPLNLFLFAPADKRHRLFVTTPLIALVATMALGVTILVQDGTGGRGERRVFVALLPGENTAAVVQEQAARAGFLLRRSFALPDDIALTVLPPETGFTYGGPNSQLERGRGTAGGDWFQSRARQAHQLRRIVPTRARIEAVGVASNGAPIVQSSLGTTLREFWYVDADQKTWGAAEVPSGQRVTLQLTPTRPNLESVIQGGTTNFRALVAAARSDETGRWWAKGGATELAPLATLRSVRWKEGEVLYTGAVESAEAIRAGSAKAKESAP